VASPQGTGDSAPHTVPCDADLARTLGPAHRLTLRQMHRPIGQSAAPLHSYLALARSDASVAAVNAVQTRLLARALRGTVHEGTPIVSATSAFKTGGRGGPQHFTDLPAGTLSLRHAADLYPFPNFLCGLQISGAGLRDWLERAAICFATVLPGEPEPMLRHARVPGHDFDVISGLTYEIDLSARPLYDRSGTPCPAGGPGRIRNLRHKGRPVKDTERFILATTSYRAFGAGAYILPDAARIIHVGKAMLRDQIVAEIAQTPLAAPSDHAQTWRFAPLPGASVRLDTGPGLHHHPRALDLLQQQTGRQADDLGLTEDGFWQLRLWL
jgi:2',3'-cyclic-nucleotide 2'-phosphodiesterase/3'-nucleotidase